MEFVPWEFFCPWHYGKTRQNKSLFFAVFSYHFNKDGPKLLFI